MVFRLVITTRDNNVKYFSLVINIVIRQLIGLKIIIDNLMHINRNQDI